MMNNNREVGILDSVLIFRNELDCFCEFLAPLLKALVSLQISEWAELGHQEVRVS